MYDVTITPHVEGDFSPKVRHRIQLACAAFLGAFLMLGFTAVVNPAPWSPIGQAEQINEQPGQVVTGTDEAPEVNI